MWIAYYLSGLEWSLAALGFGLAAQAVRGRGGETPDDGSRAWIAIGMAAQAAALAALVAAGDGFDLMRRVQLLNCGALVLFFWGGAWLRLRAMARAGRGGEALPWLPWKILLVLGQAGLVNVAVWTLSDHFAHRAGLTSLGRDRAMYISSLSMGLAVLEGALLLAAVLYWLCERPEADAGAAAALGWTIVALLIYRTLAIVFSLWAGGERNPFGGRFFLRSLMRDGAGMIIYLRWMVGLALPLGVTLSLIAQAPQAGARTARQETAILLALLALGEFLGAAFVAGTWGLAL